MENGARWIQVTTWSFSTILQEVPGTSRKLGVLGKFRSDGLSVVWERGGGR